MAEKRMFTKKITDSDAFCEMSSSAQALYFHLNQGADDDGFNNQVQMAMFKAKASIDDLKVLMAKNFIIRFESGVIVIKHWRIHNTLRKDRYTPTNFQEELSMLNLKENGAYTFSDGVVAKRLPSGCQVVATDKNSIDKDSIEKDSIDSKKECKNEYIEETNNTCVRASYEEIMKDFGVSELVKLKLFEFIKHLKLHNVVMINSRLESIIVGLDMKYKEAVDMIACIDRAIVGGHKKLEFE